MKRAQRMSQVSSLLTRAEDLQEKIDRALALADKLDQNNSEVAQLVMILGEQQKMVAEELAWLQTIQGKIPTAEASKMLERIRENYAQLGKKLTSQLDALKKLAGEQPPFVVLSNPAG